MGGGKITVPDIIALREKGERIVALAAYDYTMSRLIDSAGADLILVGDSLGTVFQGNPTTLSVTLEEIIYHSRAVVRGAARSLVIADMPFMSYQLGPKEALAACGRVVKEAGVAGVKLEGGKDVAETVASIVRAGIPVMGHVGLVPQSYHKLGGYRVQGRSHEDQERIFVDAKALVEAGVFSLVLEAIPRQLADEITRAVPIPTIGIGAGPDCSGQILVIHDLLGMTHLEAARYPKFVKRYAELAQAIVSAVVEFGDEVKAGHFPGEGNSYSG